MEPGERNFAPRGAFDRIDLADEHTLVLFSRDGPTLPQFGFFDVDAR